LHFKRLAFIVPANLAGSFHFMDRNPSQAHIYIPPKLGFEVLFCNLNKNETKKMFPIPQFHETLDGCRHLFH
jgi:hypothetical protein